MFKRFKIVVVDSQYCNYLRKFDYRVPYNYGKKELRPFVGVLLEINNCEYFAPLSSPKEKHKKMKNTIDFIKLDEGNLGAINFNNMIPVCSFNYTLIDLKERHLSEEQVIYQKLLKEQLYWLNKNYILIKDKASKLYVMHLKKELPKNIEKRCCNFLLLEEKCIEYNKTIISV